MIPVYGDSPYLRETLESIQKNIPLNIPVTVIEDYKEGISQQEIVQKFPRVKYIKNTTRLGITKNFNKCFQLSEGTYTQIIGSDDNFNNPNYIEGLNELNLLSTRQPPDLIIFDVDLINEMGIKSNSLADFTKKFLKPLKEGFLPPKRLLISLLIGQWIYFPGTLWLSDYVKRNGFDEKYQTALDLELFIRTCLAQKVVLYLKFPIIDYRRHAQSQSSSLALTGLRFKEELEIHEKYANLFKTNRMYGKYLLSRMAIAVRVNKVFSLLRNKSIYR